MWLVSFESHSVSYSTPFYLTRFACKCMFQHPTGNPACLPFQINHNFQKSFETFPFLSYLNIQDKNHKVKRFFQLSSFFSYPPRDSNSACTDFKSAVSSAGLDGHFSFVKIQHFLHNVKRFFEWIQKKVEPSPPSMLFLFSFTFYKMVDFPRVCFGSLALSNDVQIVPGRK